MSDLIPFEEYQKLIPRKWGAAIACPQAQEAEE